MKNERTTIILGKGYLVRATKIYPGMWEVLKLGKWYRYRVYTKERVNADWKVYKLHRSAPECIKVWQLVVEGLRSKATAIEYAVEEAERDDAHNPNKDLLDNIDDGIDLNDEGWDT